jgi:2-isopropylmalate synthase
VTETIDAKAIGEPCLAVRTHHISRFDATLSEGCGAPDAPMTLPAKLRIAEMLDEMGIDVIEVGFPVVSRRHFDEVRKIGSVVRRAVVCAKARAEMFDIDRAAEATRQLPHRRIRIVTGTSPWHRRHDLNMSVAQMCSYVDYAVRRAWRHTGDVEWTACDAMHTEPDVLKQIVRAAIEAGAATIGIAEDMRHRGWAEHSALIRRMCEEVPGADCVTFSVDGDDLRFAAANSVPGAAQRGWQIRTAFNGLPAKPDCAAQKEAAIAMHHRSDAPFAKRRPEMIGERADVAERSESRGFADLDRRGIGSARFPEAVRVA